MKIKTEKLLKIMNILSWIIFIGILIEAGAVVVSYFVSISNPEASKVLYKGIGMFDYRQQSFVNYSFLVAYKVFIYVMKAYIALQMTRLLTRLNISRPFTIDVVLLMQSISYSILIIWIVSVINNTHVDFLEKSYGIPAIHVSGDFIFIAGIVYVFAQMFRRGMEIQSENDLTV
jgi:hypothetical protein